MARTLLDNGPVNTPRYTHAIMEQRGYATRFTQRLGEHTSAQVQWRHIPTVLVIAWLVFDVRAASI
jgi:hypothetical protein